MFKKTKAKETVSAQNRLFGLITSQEIREARQRLLEQRQSSLFDDEEDDRENLQAMLMWGREHDTEEDGIKYQRCGGGKRLIRKSI